jgi:hypothetical protein
MQDKQQEFTDLLEFIEMSFGITLQKYQIEYLRHLIEKNSVFVSGRNMGKTALLEKYLEFKKIFG